MPRPTPRNRREEEEFAAEEERNGGLNQEGSDEEEESGVVKGLKDPIQSVQHLFLQTLISRRLILVSTASNLYDRCNLLCGVEEPEDFNSWRSNLDEPLKLCGLELKAGKDQETGRDFLILCNGEADEASRLATEYKPEEIALFRCVLYKIMTAPNLSYSVGMTDALRCVSDKAVTPTISKTNASVLFASFAAKGWLQYHPTSKRLMLTTRSLYELTPYLRKTFLPQQDDDEEDDEVVVPPHEKIYVECHTCYSLVTSGWACPNEACEVRLHKHCARFALGARGKCPGSQAGCNEIWTLNDGNFIGIQIGLNANDNHNGIESEVEDDDDQDGTPATNGKKSRRRSNSTTTPATGKKGNSKGKGKGKVVDSDEEEEDQLVDDDDEDDDDDDDDREEGGAGNGSPVTRREKSSRSSAAAAKSKFVDDEAGGGEDEDDDMNE